MSESIAQKNARLLLLCIALATQPAVRGQSTTASALPGKGLAQHPFLYCGEWDIRRPDETMYLVRGGKVVWTYAIPDAQELGDCTRLSNGNIVFSRKTGASEITPDKTIVWNYDAPSGTGSTPRSQSAPTVC